MDYESIDSPAARLYIAGMGAGKLLVFDVKSNRLVRALDNFPKITGVLAIPELHRVYASVPGAGLIASLGVGIGILGFSSGSGAVVVVDTMSLKEVARLPGGVFPDGLAFDAPDNRIFVTDELGSAVLVLDAKTDRPLGRIAVGGEVGNVRYDPIGKRVYAPVQSRNALAVIDPISLKLLRRLALAGCEHPHGLIIHPQGAVGYAACDENDVLATVDLAGGRVLRVLPVAHDPDVLTVDPVTLRLYVAGETGMLSAYDIAKADAPVLLGTVFAGPNAHSVAADPATHRLYLAIADSGGHSMVRVLAPKSSGP
jgi:DNA-binding beta-propeller fold protein YncE